MKTVKIMSLIVGSLGTVSEGFKGNIKEIEIGCPVELLHGQKYLIAEKEWIAW